MSLYQFFEDNNLAQTERRNRIRLSLAAYAYEFESDSIISDGEFDSLALKIKPEVSTIEDRHTEEERKRFCVLDEFFKTKFQPDTGQWIHDHPELDKVASLYYRLYNGK